LKKLTYGNQITLGIVLFAVCVILAHLLKDGRLINLGWILYGMLFLLHPVYPPKAEGHPRIKLYVQIAGAVIILFGLMLRNNLDHDLTSEQLRLDVTSGTVISSYNDYGGFHGDGVRYEERVFPDDRVLTYIEANPNWHSLPLPENLEILIYGKEFPGSTVGPYFSSDVSFPRVERGYYYFFDEKINSTDASQVLSRGSFNYIFAIYDVDTDQMYFATYDT